MNESLTARRSMRAAGIALSVALVAGAALSARATSAVPLSGRALSLVPAQELDLDTTPEGWARTDVAGAFTIALPPGWTYEPRAGIDSLIGSFIGPDVELRFDYGRYANPLPEPGDPGYVGQYTRISCKVAKLVTAIEAPADITGVYFPRVEGGDFLRPDLPANIATRLQIHGVDLDAAQRALALRIFETVHFPARCLQGARGEWEILWAPEDVLPIAVALHGPDDGWLVGLDAATRRAGSESVRCAAARWQEGGWTRVPCPAGDMLWGLSLTGPDEGWAVGGDSILRLRDGAWSVVSDTVDFALFDVLAEEADTGWAVGLGGGPLRLEDGAWRDDGSELEVEGTTVARGGASEVYVGGSLQLFEHGSLGWRELPSPVRDLPNDTAILDFVPQGGESGWFVGGTAPRGTGIVWRRGARGEVDWRTFSGTGSLWDLEVLEGEEDAGDLRAWAVGGDPNAQPATLLELVDDTWHALRTPFGGLLMGVDMATPEDGWAVGHQVFEPVDGFAEMRGVLLRFRPYADPPPLVTAPPGRTGFPIHLPYAGG